MAKPIPPAILAIAKHWGRKIPGFRPSLVIAMWALETGWGSSKSWTVYLNPFGISDAKDDRYQIEGNGPRAAYANVADAGKDLARIFAWYRRRADKPNPTYQDILWQLDNWWAPDWDTESNRGYDHKIQSIIDKNDLDRYDEEIEIQTPVHVADYDPVDPRGEYRIGSDEQTWVGILMSVVFGAATGTSLPLAILRRLADVAVKVEVDLAGEPGNQKEEEAIRRISQPIIEVLKVLVPIVVRLINSRWGRRWADKILAGSSPL